MRVSIRFYWLNPKVSFDSDQMFDRHINKNHFPVVLLSVDVPMVGIARKVVFKTHTHTVSL